MLSLKVSPRIGTIGELGSLIGELGPTCFNLKWSYLPDKVVPIAQMAKLCPDRQLAQPCRKIGNTL